MAGKYFRAGVSKFYFLPSVAGSSPTAPEIAAGVNITQDLSDVNNVSVQANLVDTPDYLTAFVSKVAGNDTVGDPEFVYWDRDNSTTIRTALAKGTAGYLVLMPYGDVSGKRCEVYPVSSAGVNDQYNRDTPAQFTVTFAVTAQPTQTATLP